MTGYDLDHRNNGKNGYVPISLQYDTYTAIHKRDTSLQEEVSLKISPTGVTKEKPL